jgi:hypothetical protein
VTFLLWLGQRQISNDRCFVEEPRLEDRYLERTRIVWQEALDRDHHGPDMIIKTQMRHDRDEPAKTAELYTCSFSKTPGIFLDLVEGHLARTISRIQNGQGMLGLYFPHNCQISTTRGPVTRSTSLQYWQALHPPPYTMGGCVSAAGKRRSEEIDRAIELDAKRFKRECKILLLGTPL